MSNEETNRRMLGHRLDALRDMAEHPINSPIITEETILSDIDQVAQQAIKSLAEAGYSEVQTKEYEKAIGQWEEVARRNNTRKDQGHSR
jgi:hypothetical protein